MIHLALERSKARFVGFRRPCQNGPLTDGACRTAKMRRNRRAFGFLLTLASGLLWGCPSPPRSVVYDLARRVDVAERWAANEVLVFGTPAAEPFLSEGFYREAARQGEPFLWSRGEAEIVLRFDRVSSRSAIVDLGPFRGLRDQTAEVRLNGEAVGGFSLGDQRARHLLALPPAAQRPGENRLRFVFAKTAAPAEADSGSLDQRQLAAAFHSLTVAGGEGALEDLLRRDAPRPFAVSTVDGAKALSLIGPALVRFAVRVPAGGELRFTPELALGARAASGAASFRVTFESEDQPGVERELWSRVLRGNDKSPGEVAIPLPGPAGRIARVGLLLGSVDGGRFAWGEWRAPRILGRESDPLAPQAPSPPPSASASASVASLRDGLKDANVVLVILDAARARQFGAYGYGRATTPEIDRIAKDGIVFENAYTPAVYTLGAMSSVWTSQPPDRHHDDVSFSSALPKDRLTLAEVLSGQGIFAAGFVATAVPGGFNGFDRGFSEFRELWREVGSRADVFRQVLPPWLARNKDRRFFAYLHLREPHFPYDPEPPFDTRFGPDGPIPKSARRDMDFFRDVNQGRRPLSPEEREHLVRLYDGNLGYADQEVGALRRSMEAAGLWDKTVFIVSADHGEALGEHGWIGHNVEVYEPSARIPLIVRLPGGVGPRGTRVSGLVDLLDVAPTVAEVFGVGDKGGADREFLGRSLLPMILGAPGKPLVLSRTVWDRPRYALRDGRYAYMYETATGVEHLFDANADPGETKDLARSEALRTAYYRETLLEWTRGVPRTTRAAGGTVGGMTPAQCANLKALGYLGSDQPCPK
jgi:arylsulfatase A-like enzyme